MEVTTTIYQKKVRPFIILFIFIIYYLLFYIYYSIILFIILFYYFIYYFILYFGKTNTIVNNLFETNEISRTYDVYNMSLLLPDSDPPNQSPDAPQLFNEHETYAMESFFNNIASDNNFLYQNKFSSAEELRLPSVYDIGLTPPNSGSTEPLPYFTESQRAASGQQPSLKQPKPSLRPSLLPSFQNPTVFNSNMPRQAYLPSPGPYNMPGTTTAHNDKISERHPENNLIHPIKSKQEIMFPVENSSNCGARGGIPIMPLNHNRIKSERLPSKPRQKQQRRREFLSDSQKRANHIQSEQKRRDVIKQGFLDLERLVPALHGQTESKSVTLQLAADFIEQMVEKNRQLRLKLGL